MLKISNLEITFNRGTVNESRALQGVDLEVEEGSFVIVLGSNGSGKSTLQNAIAGSYQVDKGSIEIAGENVTKWPEHRRAKLIGRVFQNPFSGTAPNMTIAENFALASKRGLGRGLSTALNRKFREELKNRIGLLKMNLENRLDNEMASLSGGQRQALTLLMATWLKPKLLLLDEHTAALDPKSAEQVIHLTKEVVGKEKLTTMMVTHSMHQAVKLGNRLIMMHRGNIIHDFKGAEKERLRVDDLLTAFEEVRRTEMLDESVAKLLEQNYV